MNAAVGRRIEYCVTIAVEGHEHPSRTGWCNKEHATFFGVSYLTLDLSEQHCLGHAWWQGTIILNSVGLSWGVKIMYDKPQPPNTSKTLPAKLL